MNTEDEAIQPLLKFVPILAAIGTVSIALLIFWGQW